jgi:hypothetical protein
MVHSMAGRKAVSLGEKSAAWWVDMKVEQWVGRKVVVWAVALASLTVYMTAVLMAGP